MDRAIFAAGIGVFVAVVIGMVLTVLEFRRCMRGEVPRDPRFPM